MAHRGAEVEAQVLAEARRVAEAYGIAEGSEEWYMAVQGAIDSLSEEEAEVLHALEGARICEAHWRAEGDTELLEDAEARTQRLLDGTATEEDILGALDWLG